MDNKEKIREQIKEMKKNQHCESCGEINPETEDGYTTCCNELVCDHDTFDRYGTKDNYVKACCWAFAELKFELEGKEVPEEGSRF